MCKNVSGKLLVTLGVLCFLSLASYAQISIGSIDKLQKIGKDAAFPADGNYVLSQDIDASAASSWNDGKGFEPLCLFNPEGRNTPFTGTFDGQGYKITGLVINRSDQDYVALFSFVGEGGTVKNLGIEGGSVSGNHYAAGLVSENRGTIMECYTSCKVIGIGNYAGGLVSINGGTIQNCYAKGNVKGKQYVGGLVAYNAATVEYCYAVGPVSGQTDIGGLAGETVPETGITRNAFWDVTTSGQANSDGGTGLVTAKMKQAATYTAAGWNFSSVWRIVENQSYPLLKVFDEGGERQTEGEEAVAVPVQVVRQLAANLETEDTDGDNQLNPDEADELTLEQFNQLDTDNNGNLSAAELQAYLDANKCGQNAGKSLKTLKNILASWLLIGMGMSLLF